MPDIEGHLTVCYKKTPEGVPIYFDIWPPISEKSTTSERSSSTIPSVSVVLYFHGGGLTAGNRRSWFPLWLQRRATSSGHAFISADYRLLPPATGHDIVKDIKDLFAYLKDPLLSFTLPSRPGDEQRKFKVDPESIVVSGSSAGGFCAYLAAINCTSPKPKAIFSLYGMGGDLLTPTYLSPKKDVFFRGREILDPADFQEYLYPSITTLQAISDSPLAYHPDTYHIPGYPANPRMLLVRLYFQLGTFLDYYTGEHNPSLSSVLRVELEQRKADPDTIPSNESIIAKIPNQHRILFPQLGVNSSWPPTLFLHGTADTAIPIHESRLMHSLIKDAGVPTELVEFEGLEHSFDYEADAEENFGEQFDAARDFIDLWIGRKPL
ncbi:hypothetical protein K443DRAFT_681987 [Laccaria amethystina LaAM-08-1]|uniref:Alpha/beta hydrolase fold-3 domain-containing protein n=1 Tax=Laccaria amethystina LaAM-08-1 TaxID=1095629 RepID=A0A0C9WL08_9AGAR|nr:hypothetical protein K443DRAFT_681987 [Laccaria amethystina LaAM-08-1]